MSWFRGCLGLFLALCAGAAAGDAPKDSPQPADAAAKREKKLSPGEAFAEAAKRFQKMDIAGAVRIYEQAVEDNGDDVGLLFGLAQATSTLAVSQKPNTDYKLYLKSADAMRRAFKANPAFEKLEGIRQAAGPIFYNEACALALDNKADQALERLKAAVDHGFKDVALMESDQDLKAVRALAGYAEFRARVNEDLRAQREKEVETILKENTPFDFDFELTDIDGSPIKMADFKGKVLVVDVWGTWCPPCRKEVPHFVALQKKYADAGLVVVGLNSEGLPDQEQALKRVRDFREANHMNYRSALVTDFTLQDIPDFNAFPTTMFFDRAGNVRAKVVGYRDYEILEGIVRRLLDEKAPSVAAGKGHPAFGTPGYYRRTSWSIPEQRGWQGHFWISSFSPDGQTYMISGDSGPRGGVRLWETATGKLRPELRTDRDVWYANAKFLPDGKQVVIGYHTDKDMYLWDVATGELVRRFTGHTADSVTPFVSHDGRHLVSKGEDGSLRLWDVGKTEPVWTREVPAEKIVDVAFSPDDRWILTSGGDRTLRVRELETGNVAATLEGHEAPCAGEFSPDGRTVLSWADDGPVRLWDARTGKLLRTFDGHAIKVQHAWHLDGGRQILTWTGDSSFKVWDAASGEKIREFVVPDKPAPGWSEAVVSPEGCRLLVASTDGADVRLVDLLSGKELYRSPAGKVRKGRGFSFSPDGRSVAAGSFRSGVYLLSVPGPSEGESRAEPKP